MASADCLKILVVASEMSPYAKSGGLGDVVGSLPKELQELGVDARVVIPKYRTLNPKYHDKIKYIDSFIVALGWRQQNASIYCLEDSVSTYLIENDYYFGRDGFYGYGDDYERFAFFSKAAIEFLGIIDFKPDIIHFNDWQTGPACVYLKDLYSKFYFYQGIKTLFTIHNLQYQGVFGRDILNNIELSDSYFASDKMEFYGNVNYMKTGLVYSDAISTVSNAYAEEIKTSQYGYGLDGVLRSRADSLFGILNGIDSNAYNPATDTRIFQNYDINSIDIKSQVNKNKLREQLGLPQWDVPLIGIISRLADQKGFDLVALCMEEIMHMDVQVVLLGTGEGRYENMFKNYAYRFPEKMSSQIYFNEDLAQKIYAGSDMFLMPSLFEPCGLGQMYAMRYGSVPIVRKTGGLADTVQHYNMVDKTGNGFVFQDYVASGMMWAIRQALQVYSDKGQWRQVVRNAMEGDFSWKRSAQQYVELYTELKNK